MNKARECQDESSLILTEREDELMHLKAFIKQLKDNRFGWSALMVPRLVVAEPYSTNKLNVTVPSMFVFNYHVT